MLKVMRGWPPCREPSSHVLIQVHSGLLRHTVTDVHLTAPTERLFSAALTDVPARHSLISGNTSGEESIDRVLHLTSAMMASIRKGGHCHTGNTMYRIDL